MGAQSLVLRLSPSGSLPPLKDFKSSSFGSSAPCFVQTNRWCSMLANPLLYLSSCRTKYSRRTLLCEASSQKVEGFNADLGSSDSKPSRKNLAVFVSGGGSNFKAIHSATLNGSILGDVVVLVTNKQGCGGAAYARENNIPVVLFPRTKEESEGLSPEDLVTALRYSGPTIHLVDEQYDTGRIVAQRVVPVCAFDTPEELAARVLHEEHRLYVDVVAALCEDRIIWRDDGVPLIQSKENPNQYS